MPFGDRTGPMGMGPMTGRAAGYCAGFGVPGYMNPIPGRGAWGWGRGWARGFGRGGRGWRHWFYATGLPGWMRAQWGWPSWGVRPYAPGAVPFAGPYAPQATAKQEADALKAQAECLSETLEEVKKRIEELERASDREA